MLPALAGTLGPGRAGGRALKRTLDLVGAAVVGIVLAPVVLVAAAISVASYRSWPFFTQARVGRHGRPFRLVKVRTLHPRTPADLPKAELEAHRPNAACRFLRAHHLDELPQLLNVLGGSMSLVGPRPELVELADRLPPGFSARRTEVRPGLTGLWQISRAVEGMIGDAPAYDDWYLAARSLRLDGWILWRTATLLVGASPIETLDDLPGWAASGGVASIAGVGDRAA